MIYATQADLEKLLPEKTLIALTDDDNLGVVAVDTVESALEAASVTIDGYLGDAEKLAFTEPPPILTQLCVYLAGYLLYLRRNQVSELWQERSGYATKYLDELSRGLRSLGLADPAGTGNKESLQVSAPDALFGQDTLEKY